MRNLLRISVFAVLLLTQFTCARTARERQLSDWFPVLSHFVHADDGSWDGASWKRIREIAGVEKKPEALWIDAVDVDGDLREDAMLTMAFGESAGARAYLRTRTTYVLLGKRPAHAVFSIAESRLWFSLPTYWCMGRVKYPDVEVRRQFSLSRDSRGWYVHIREVRYTNEAGDSWSRGMHLDKTRDSLVPLQELDSWAPMTEY